MNIGYNYDTQRTTTPVAAHQGSGTSGHRPRIALVGDHNPTVPAHPRLDALRDGLRERFEMTWTPTDSIEGPEQFAHLDGVWVVPGSPYRSMAGALASIRAARIYDIPFLGTCGGFQHALIDHARTYAGYAEAGDVQYGIAENDAVITALSCSLVGERASLQVAPDTVLAQIYREHPNPVELYHCSYGLNPALAYKVVVDPLVVSARDAHGATRAIERTDLTFFLATLFQPELVSTPDKLHPLIAALLQAASHHYAHRLAAACSCDSLLTDVHTPHFAPTGDPL